MESNRFYGVCVTLVMLSCLIHLCKGQCPPGWKNFHNTSCYLISTQSLPWREAFKNCSRIGGNLAKITSKQENDFIANQTRGNGTFWIGGFLDMTESLSYQFAWNDWTTIGFTNWKPGQPDTHYFHGAEACIDISSVDGKWTDHFCFMQKQFICEKAANLCQVNNGGCPHKCSFMNGKAVCSCRKGFISSEEGTKCQDLAKRLTENGTWQVSCDAKSNSGSCVCPSGYQPNKLGDVWICNDLNECKNNNGGCQHVCANTPGSFKCFCHRGFVLNQDENNCSTIPLATESPSTTPPQRRSSSNPTEMKTGPASPEKLHAKESGNDSNSLENQESLLKAAIAILIILLAVVIFSVLCLLYYLPRMRGAWSVNAKYKASCGDESCSPAHSEFSNPVYDEIELQSNLQKQNREISQIS